MRKERGRKEGGTREEREKKGGTRGTKEVPRRDEGDEGDTQEGRGAREGSRSKTYTQNRQTA
jgi:hypothetical protein